MELSTEELEEQLLNTWYVNWNEGEIDINNEEFIDDLVKAILVYYKDGKYHHIDTFPKGHPKWKKGGANINAQPGNVRTERSHLRQAIITMTNSRSQFNKYWTAMLRTFIVFNMGDEDKPGCGANKRYSYALAKRTERCIELSEQNKELRKKLNNETERCGLCGSDDFKFKMQCRDEAYNNLPHGDKEWAEKYEKLEARCGKFQDQVISLTEQLKSRHETEEKNEEDHVESLSKTIVDRDESINRLRLKVKKLEETNQSQKTKHSQEVKELKSSLKSDDKKTLEIQKLNEKIIKQDLLIKELKKNKPKKKKTKISQEQILTLLQQLQENDSDSD
jgi:hypothetical protein